MVLRFRELGRARTSLPQMFYLYVTDNFFKENWMGRELCPKFLYMHVNDVDIFITESWAPHPKLLYK